MVKKLTPHQIGIVTETPTECQSLDDVRQAIDTIDAQIIALLGMRLGYVLGASRFKANAAAIPAPERVAAMLPERRKWSAEAGLDHNFIVPLFSQIIQWFIQQQICFWHSKKN